MKTRFAFAGFRHGHAFDLLEAVRARTDLEVVACCEQDAATRAQLAADGRVAITHSDFSAMLRDVPCEVVAIGDTYARRGALAIAALAAGRHVLSDKPLCTNLAEQAEIERLAAAQQLQVGLQLTCRESAAFRTLRGVLRSGEIGEVAALHVAAQHALLAGSRAAWYFAPGEHGGTINDIGIHAFDLVPWLTGLEWREVTSARCWNAKARAFPHFRDAAQMMATLSNGAGVLADFSYLAPDRLGTQLPHYWQVTVHGTRGFAQTHLLADHVTVIGDADPAPRIVPATDPRPLGYLADFLHSLRGEPEAAELHPADCLRASRLALETQCAGKNATR